MGSKLSCTRCDAVEIEQIRYENAALIEELYSPFGRDTEECSPFNSPSTIESLVQLQSVFRRINAVRETARKVPSFEVPDELEYAVLPLYSPHAPGLNFALKQVAEQVGTPRSSQEAASPVPRSLLMNFAMLDTGLSKESECVAVTEESLNRKSEESQGKPAIDCVSLPHGAAFISELPDYSTDLTRQATAAVGPFTPTRDSSDHTETIQLDAVQLEDGSVYIGEWNFKGEFHGLGKLLLPDGTEIEGWFRCGKTTYRARIVHPDGDLYEGDWKDDLAHGQGRYVYLNGAVYEGAWANDTQTGFGIETWPDGTRYEGAFQDNLKHGKGKLLWSNNSKYEGRFAQGLFHGYGEYVWETGSQYKGCWQAGKMHGKGKLQSADGSVYTGEFANDKKHGRGVLVWPDGRKYDGEWLLGNEHGTGVSITATGSTRKGNWRNGRLIKELP